VTLTVTGAVLDGEPVGVRCAAGRIEAIGPEVAAQPGDEALDAAGALLVPPLLNGHTHAAMTLFRGSGGDLPLMPWLRERIWPVEAKLEGEDVLLGRPARLRRDDPLRHQPLLGHVLAARADGAGGRRRRPAGNDRRAADRRQRRRGGDARGGPRQPRPTRLARGLDRTGACPARDLHGQRRVAALDRRARRRARGPIHIHLSEDEPGGPGLASPPTASARAAYLDRLRGPDRADAARPRRLARPGRARPGRRAGRHRGHQPGGEHEAGGRCRLPLPGGARGRGRGRARHRRKRAPTTRSTCSPT